MKRQIVLPWVCDLCGEEWVDRIMVTWIDCPKCGCEAVFHDNARDLQESDYWYVINE